MKRAAASPDLFQLLTWGQAVGCSAGSALGFFFSSLHGLLKQPILAPLTPVKEILYELESVRKDLMRLS